MNQLTLPLSNVQTELLRLYATNLPESDLAELKQLLARFYAERAIRQANRIWDDRGLANADMNQWLTGDSGPGGRVGRHACGCCSWPNPPSGHWAADSDAGQCGRRS